MREGKKKKEKRKKKKEKKRKRFYLREEEETKIGKVNKNSCGLWLYLNIFYFKTFIFY